MDNSGKAFINRACKACAKGRGVNRKDRRALAKQAAGIIKSHAKLRAAEQKGDAELSRAEIVALSAMIWMQRQPIIDGLNRAQKAGEL